MMMFGQFLERRNMKRYNLKGALHDIVGTDVPMFINS